MSIKGNFSDITFAELLKIISKYNGRLGIWNFQEKKQYECFLQNENMIYVNINGQNVIDPDIITRFLSDLSSDKQSYYSFQKDAILDFIPKLNLSMSKVISLVISSNTVELESEQNLPNNLTKFEIEKDFNGHLPPELASFWNLTITHFHLGCSASEIADNFGIILRDVQFNIYKLRTIGAIKPIRLFKINNVSSKTRSASANLQKLVNMRNGVKTAPSTTNDFQPKVSDAQEANVNSFATNIQRESLENQDSILEKKSFDNFGLDKVITNENNDQFLNKYVPTTTPPNLIENKTKEIEVKVEERNNTALSNNPPIFDLNTGTTKQSIVRRMLASIFSRKAQ